MVDQSKSMEDETELMPPREAPRKASVSSPDKRPSLLDRYKNSWWPEIAALCLSSLSTIAIFAVLGAFDGKSNPSLAYDLTLNATISILATTSKVSLMFAVSNTLGQSKWIWFSGRSSRQLLDAETIDDASRGPLGAAIMLITRTRKSIGSIGATLILLALADDPFS